MHLGISSLVIFVYFGGILGEGEELSAPDSLTKAAESAMRNEMTDIAAVAVRECFLQDPPRNQFYCRSLFVKAQLESLKVNGLDGDKALAQTQKAIDIVLAAVLIVLHSYLYSLL